MENRRVTRVRFAGKSKVEIVKDVLPPLAGGEVLIRVEACGICGSDLHQYTGRWKQPDFTPGHEFSGVVTGCGPDVKCVETGDRVTVEPILACGKCTYCREGSTNLCTEGEFLTSQRNGGMATHAIVPAHILHRLPENLPFQEAALIEPLAVAVHCFRKLGELDGLKIGVVGAGTVGLLCVQTARAMGAAHITCVAKHPFQEKLAAEFGADIVVGGTSVPEDLSGSLDAAVECVGGRGEALRQAIKLTRPAGTIMVVGGYQGLAGIDVEDLVDREITLTGSRCYSESDSRHDMDAAIDMASGGEVSLEPLITHVFPLAQAPRAFETACDRAGTGAVKVVLDCKADIIST